MENSLPAGDVIDWDDDTFARVYNDLANTISKYAPGKVSDPVKVGQYAEKIHKLWDDPAVVQEIEQEEDEVQQKIKRKLAGIEAEKERFRMQANGSLQSFADFKKDFYRTIKEQVLEVQKKRDSYTKFNRRFDGEDVLVKGSTIDEYKLPQIPIIDIFLDCSGSFSDFREQAKAIASVLVYFEQRGEIKLNIHYCASEIYPTWQQAIDDGSTDFWDEMIQLIKQNGSTNVVLMTDKDEEYDAKNMANPIVIPGHVWFLWPTQWARCEAIVNKIRGKRGVSEYLAS